MSATNQPCPRCNGPMMMFLDFTDGTATPGCRRGCTDRAAPKAIVAERDAAREALAMIASEVPWVKLSDVREYARGVLANAPYAPLVAERDELRAEVRLLRTTIKHAPHAYHCEAGASLFPGDCNCWKRERER